MTSQEATFFALMERATIMANLDGDATLDNGLCGFASIHMPANTPFAKWAMRAGIFKKSPVQSGCYYWCRYYGQSYIKKMIWAQTFARVLRDEGINAWTSDSLD